LFDDAGVGDHDFALVSSYGDYTTNLPVADLVDHDAMVAVAFDAEPIEEEHGGPVRLVVPHLYFWKSAKWLREIRLSDDEDQGFWEAAGYHNYGDPWSEQRYYSD
jgi:DMSO/TMAO reductase YedYZ molybdopterin-dependent catalytic subunit